MISISYEQAQRLIALMGIETAFEVQTCTRHPGDPDICIEYVDIEDEIIDLVQASIEDDEDYLEGVDLYELAENKIKEERFSYEPY